MAQSIDEVSQTGSPCSVFIPSENSVSHPAHVRFSLRTVEVISNLNYCLSMAKHGKKSRARKRKSGRTAARDFDELKMARTLWIQNRFNESLQYFDKAVRKEPGNPMALADAARAFGARFEIERAERLLHRLCDISDQRPDALQMAGQSYRMIQRPRKAIECLEAALQLNPALFESRLELAILYERQHQLDHAMRHVTACLVDHPESWESKFLLARLNRRMGEPHRATQRLRDITTSKAHWTVRTQAWFELAQLHDQAGEFGAALEAIKSGKSLQKPHVSGELDRARNEERHTTNVIEQVTDKHFQSWRSSTSDLEPHRVALLTGPPRSGTTLLEKVLDGHPDIVSSDEQVAFPKFIYPSLLAKKSHSLLGVSDLDGIPLQRIEVERTRYLRYMSEAIGEPIGDRLHIDKNPSIIPLIPAMLRLWPECRLLIAIRDPRDVVLSCYMRYLPMNAVSAQFLTMEGTVKRYQRDIQDWMRLRERLDPSQWKEVRYEDTVANLEHQARQVTSFLGISWHDEILDYREQLGTRPTNSPTYEDVARPVYRSSIARWKNYPSLLEPVLPQLQPLVDAFGYAE
jgi:tetratricopeptide (TPR) repeat protein